MGRPDEDRLPFDEGLEPPMANGEVTFEAPWQGRVFGMARLLAEQGCYSWDEFRAHLIRQIGDWERSDNAADPSSEYRYYDHFLAAFQALLAEKRLLEPGALENRSRMLEARPHGHDH